MVEAYWQRKQQEGTLAAALDRVEGMLRALPILKHYHAALNYAGNIRTNPGYDEAELTNILQTAAVLRNLYLKYTGTVPPEPTAYEGRLGLDLMYGAAFQRPQDPTHESNDSDPVNGVPP
jgi:hypothetical protein